MSLKPDAALHLKRSKTILPRQIRSAAWRQQNSNLKKRKQHTHKLDSAQTSQLRYTIYCKLWVLFTYDQPSTFRRGTTIPPKSHLASSRKWRMTVRRKSSRSFGWPQSITIFLCLCLFISLRSRRVQQGVCVEKVNKDSRRPHPFSSTLGLNLEIAWLAPISGDLDRVEQLPEPLLGFQKWLRFPRGRKRASSCVVSLDVGPKINNEFLFRLLESTHQICSPLRVWLVVAPSSIFVTVIKINGWVLIA